MTDTRTCPRCWGTGSVRSRLGRGSPVQMCALCKGTGVEPDERTTSVLAAEALLEELAALEHDQWTAAVRPVMEALARGGWLTRGEDESDAEFEARTQRAKRWHDQVGTAYAQLSEAEKDLDREWARKVLAIVERHAKGATHEEGEGGEKAMAGP